MKERTVKVIAILILAVTGISLISWGFYLDWDKFIEVCKSPNPVKELITYSLFGLNYVGSWLIGLGGFFLLTSMLGCARKI